MERLKRGIFITPKEIQILTGFAKTTAQREHKLIRDSLSRSTKRLTVREYCNYFEINFQEVVNYLNQYR